MKRLLAILIPLVILCSLCSCGINNSYIGTYRLDTGRKEQDIAVLYQYFGSSLRDYGAEMVLNEDGTFSYYLGLTGGEGVYTIDGSVITASVTDYAEGNRTTLILYLIIEGDTTYILYPYDDGVNTVNIWWIKQE